MEKHTVNDLKGSLKIIAADDEPIIIMNLVEMLEGHGFEVVGSATDGFEAIELCRANHADVVLLDIKMPILDGLTAAQVIFEEKLADTIIMVTAFDEAEFVDKASQIGVAAYLVKPITEKTLIPCINIAQARSKELCRLRDEVSRAQKTIEARKLIERAKGMIMKKNAMTEQDAYDYIRKLSKDKCISMEKVSELLLRSLSS